MKKILFCFALICVATTISAEEMNSDNYSILSDSINIGGGLSTSTNFSLEDTAGEVATGISTSTNYRLLAGYQQMQTGVIVFTPGTDVTLSPSIGGITGGTSNGSYLFTVATDNEAGYTATIRASTTPAMTSGAESIADYTPAGADPDFAFAISATASEFGFSPEGDDIASRYKDNGSVCNAGSGDTGSACWDALSTSSKTIMQRLSSTDVVGTDSVIRFRVQVGASRFQPEGVYTATTTITVLPL